MRGTIEIGGAHVEFTLTQRNDDAWCARIERAAGYGWTVDEAVNALRHVCRSRGDNRETESQRQILEAGAKAGLSFPPEPITGRLRFADGPADGGEEWGSIDYRLFQDGNQWCALAGDDLQSGIAGFGDTARDAVGQLHLHATTGRRWTEPCETDPNPTETP